jgi:hypothetical protein
MKLSRFETTWAEASMEAIYPGSKEHGLAGIDAMGLRAFLHELMLYLPFRAALGMRVAIWLVAIAPLLVLGRARTIARLAPVDRERVVVALATSRLYVVRSLVLILKTMGALLYGGDATVRARMMAAPPPTSGIRPVADPAQPAPAGAA